MVLGKNKDFFWKYPYQNAEVNVSSCREDTKKCHNNDPTSLFIVNLQWNVLQEKNRRKTNKIELYFYESFTTSSMLDIPILYFGESRLKCIKKKPHTFHAAYFINVHAEGLTPRITHNGGNSPPKTKCNSPKIHRSFGSFSPKHLSNLRKSKQ